MDENQRKILEMIDQGIITAEEGARLLTALGDQKSTIPTEPVRPAPEKGLHEAVVEMGGKAIEIGKEAVEAAKQAMEAAKQATGFVFEDFPNVGVQDDPNEGDTRASFREYPPMKGRLERLDIKWLKGDVELVLTDGDEIKVKEFSPYFDSGDNTRVEKEDEELIISWDANCFRRSTEEPPHTKTRHLVVELPRTTASSLEGVTIKSVSGAVILPDLNVEDLNVSLVSGDIRGSQLQAEDMKLSCVSGSINLVDVQGEDVEISSISGEVNVLNFRGEDVMLKNVSGELKAIGHSEGLDVNTTSGSAKVILTKLCEDVTLRTVSGMVSLKIPESTSGFTVDYNIQFGHFHSDFALEGTLGAKSGEGVYGDGDMDISATAVTGMIELLHYE